jgi:signal transduction histidine kinase
VKAISLPTAEGGITDRIARLGRLVITLRWPFRPAWLDATWAVFSTINLIAIFAFAGWETIPFHFIWISFTLVYGFRTWAPKPTLWVLGVVMATTAAAIGQDVALGAEPGAELTEVPLMAAMFLVMVWHARRKLAAEQESRLIGEENARLLATQRRFLQDASHQLRTPITIALGHAELLARGLTSRQEGHDIQVILGELNRLRRIAERLLVIAAAEGPEFLHLEPVALDSFTMEILRRWRPTADRSWQLGRLDRATVEADRERLGLAIDALLENAVRHTSDGDVIKLSVVAAGRGLPVRIVIADAGQGIPAELLGHLFDRFRTGDSGHPRGTGLGLALVRAVARAHGGQVLVTSHLGRGSEFELLLPGPPGPLALSPAAPTEADAADGRLARKPLRSGWRTAEHSAERTKQGR